MEEIQPDGGAKTTITPPGTSWQCLFNDSTCAIIK